VQILIQLNGLASFSFAKPFIVGKFVPGTWWLPGLLSQKLKKCPELLGTGLPSVRVVSAPLKVYSNSPYSNTWH